MILIHLFYKIYEVTKRISTLMTSLTSEFASPEYCQSATYKRTFFASRKSYGVVYCFWKKNYRTLRFWKEWCHGRKWYKWESISADDWRIFHLVFSRWSPVSLAPTGWNHGSQQNHNRAPKIGNRIISRSVHSRWPSRSMNLTLVPNSFLRHYLKNKVYKPQNLA